MLERKCLAVKRQRYGQGLYLSNTPAEQRQLAGLDAPGGNYYFREPSKAFGFALHEHNFGALVTIEVNVLAAKDAIVGLVLQVGKGLGKGVLGVIVDDAQNADDVGPRVGPLSLDQGSADKVAHGFGSIVVAVVGHPVIEFLE